MRKKIERKPRTIRRGTARQGAWSAIRVLRHFRVEDLGGGCISLENLRHYLVFLIRVGYVKRTAHGEHLLVRDTGIKAPIYINHALKYKAYDPNLDAYFECKKPKLTDHTILSVAAKSKLKAMCEIWGRTEVARVLECGKSAISLLLNDKYPASAKNLQKRIMELRK